ncbi:polysaccharide lyase family 1 protein [Treponema sp.]|uniref:pectate lyase family protein n=1 Tax=Treponema sp. TaxID=166 RepID=UPI00388FFE1A
MNKKLAVFSVLVLFSLSAFAQSKLNVKPGEAVITYGWADMGKIKYSAKKITLIDDAAYPDPVKKRKVFTKAINAGTFVVLSGDVDLGDGVISDEDHSYFDEFAPSHGRMHNDIVYPVASNTTLIGINNARIKFGGLVLSGVSNIIIQNIEFWDAHGSTEIDTKHNSESKASIDNLVIKDGSKNIWIDHCTFSDGLCYDMSRNYHHDGLIDIPYGMNITISYCEFKNHDKVMLVGSSEKSLSPRERTVTLHHNYFHGTTQRMPRTRGTYMHIYNNVYDNIGVEENNGYSLGPGTGALFIVENNYFGNHKAVVLDFYDKSTGKKPSAYVFQWKNNIELSAANSQARNDKVNRMITDHFVSQEPWKIPYQYEDNMQSWEEAKENVLKNAGAGKEVEISGL